MITIIDDKLKNDRELIVIEAMRKVIDEKGLAQLYLNGTGFWARSVRSHLDSSLGVKTDEIDELIADIIDWVNRLFSDSFRLEHWSLGKPEPFYHLAILEAFDERSCVLTEVVEDFFDRRLKALIEKAEYFAVYERIIADPKWACERVKKIIKSGYSSFEEFSELETYFLCLIAGDVADLSPLDVVFDDAFLNGEADGSAEFLDDKTDIVWDLLEQTVLISLARISDNRINDIIHTISKSRSDAEAAFTLYLELKQN